MKWQCQDSQLAKTKRSCQESARPDAAADVPCVPSRATVCFVRELEWKGGKKRMLAKTFSHWCQPDTCLCTPHGLRYHLILSHRSVGGPLSPFFLPCCSLPSVELAPDCSHPAHPFRWSFPNRVLAAGHCNRMPVFANYFVLLHFLGITASLHGIVRCPLMPTKETCSKMQFPVFFRPCISPVAVRKTLCGSDSSPHTPVIKSIASI